MPTITNFGDVVTQGNTTATGNLTVQGTGTCAFSSASSAVTMAGTLAVTGVTTHTSNIIPSADLGCGIGTSGTRFGNIYSANTNIYTTANIFTANIILANVTNTATFQNSVYHFQNTFSTGYIQTTGVIIPTTTGISGLGGPTLLFANAFLQTANIGSTTAQLSMNVTGNVVISNAVTVTNLFSVTANATYMNVITGGYANMASINVFTGANATFLTVQTLANVYGTANIVTSNTQTANIVTSNVQNINVSTGANTTYLSVQTLANVYGTANIVTSNTQFANIVTSNIQNLNVYLSTNTAALTVTGIANVFSANVLTSNIQSANVVFANVLNLNVSTGANTTYLSVQTLANVYGTANIVTSNTQFANIVTSNIQNLNVYLSTNTAALTVTGIANVFSANVLTSNIQSANVVFANVQNLNVSTGANTTYLSVQTLANVYGTANIITSNIQFANIVTSNIQNLNVYLSTNTTALTVTGIANIFSANVLTANVQSANVVTANVQNLNVSTGANITTLFVQTFANILSSNIVSAFHSTMNVSSVANVFTANIYNGNVQTTFNVSGLLSATLHSGNASALSNINASNVTMGVLPFRNDGAIGLGATAISINGSVGVNNQYLSSTGTSLQWVGPPAAIFSQVPTSTNQIFYNSGNVAMGVYNWTQFGVGYNTYPGVPLDVYGGSGSFSNVSDATYTGTIRIMQNAASWAANGGLEFKTGTNIAGAGHRIVTTEITSSSGIAPLIFQYRANTPVWSNAMVIHNGTTTPGYVGIGTMAPLFQLHVYQTSNTAPATLTVQMSNTGQSSQLYLSNASGTTTQLYLNGPNQSVDGPVNSATLRNNAGDLRLAALGTNPYIYLQNSTSNVGINTTTATQTLDVRGYARIGSSGSDTARLILGRAPGTTNFDYASMIESVSTFASNYQSTLKFYTHGTGATGADPTLAMTINPTQQVGIGVAPGYKFHVDNGANNGINAVVQASTIVAGNTTSMILGKALSTNNSATFVWNHVGEGLATNYLGLGYYGGDNKLCVTASGNVGVGVTNPSSTLHLGATINNKIISLYDTAGTAAASATDFYGFGISSGILRYQTDSITSSHVFYTGASERMRVAGDGNVGIGITNPSSKLHVVGATSISSTASFSFVNSGTGLNSSGGDYVNTEIILGDYGPFLRGVQSTPAYTDQMRLDICTNVGSNNSARVPRITVLPGTASGYVGIGTTSPGYPLDVTGDMHCSGAIYCGNNSGATAAGSIGGRMFFGGTYGDQNYSDGGQILSRLYATTESSELVIFKGNDANASVSLADRIRLRAGAICFDTYTGASSDPAAENIRMVVDQNGNVGIGYNSPQSIMHVQVGDVVPSASGNMTTGLIISQASGGPAMCLGARTTGGNYTWIHSAYTNNSSVTAPLALQPIGGYVGIGVTNPIRTFHLNGGEFSFTPSSTTAYLNISDSAGNSGGNYTLIIRGLGSAGAAQVGIASFSVVATASTFSGTLSSGEITTTGSLNMTGNSTRIKFNSTSSWSGDAGTGFGKLEYHSNRWYINAGSDSAMVCQFRRGGSDVAYVDNSGTYVGNGLSGGAVSATTGSFSGVLTANGNTNQMNRTRAYSSSYGASYGVAAFEMREYNLEGATGAGDMNRAPRIGFHWAGVVASSIAMDSAGRIGIWNNPGTSYERFASGTYYNSGSIGIRMDPTYALDCAGGQAYFMQRYQAGYGWNRFTGYLNEETRSQVVLQSLYSDMIISSSEYNGTHGSTLSFVANSPANNDYRKFVINVGNWGGYGAGGYGDRMSFGWKDAAYTNPHGYVTPDDSVMCLDGRNKRVGINNIGSPAYSLDVNGQARTTGEIIVSTINNYGQFRAIAGAYGSFIRNDGSDTYLMVTNAYDQYGAWSGLRPFRFNNGNGSVTCDNGIYTSVLYSSGDVVAYNSDIRTKTVIGPITNALDKLLTLSTFHYVNNELAVSMGLEADRKYIGLSAQEVEKVCPEVVRLAPFDAKQDEKGTPVSKSGENYKTIQYDRLLPLVIAALKEETVKREYLEKEVAELKQLVQNLLARQ